MKKNLLNLKVKGLLLAISFTLFYNTSIGQEYHQILQSIPATQAQHLQSLVEDVQPAVYLSNDKSDSYGAGLPVLLNCDVTAIHRLYSSHPFSSSIEMIRFDIRTMSDLSAPFDLSQINGFNSLQYILIVFQFDICGNNSDSCISSYVNSFILNTTSKINVIYKLEVIQ